MASHQRIFPDYSAFSDLTYGKMLDRIVEEFPDKEFLIFQDQRISYSDFKMRVLQIAMTLKRLGSRKGDRVGVLFPNCPEFFYVQQATLYVGGIFIPLSTRYRKFEISYMMKHAGARFLFCVDEYMDTRFVDLLGEIREDLPELETVIVKGQSVPEWAKSFDIVMPLREDFNHKELTQDLPSQEDPASILYTSGSTGMPKGVLATHRGHIRDSMGVCERLQIGPEDVFLLMLPCPFIFASFGLFTNAMMGRSKIVMMENFEPEEALRLQEAEGVTLLYGVPTMFTLMLGHPDFEKFDLSKNRTGYISGSSCPPELTQAIHREMNCSICQGYGMTEACGCISIASCDEDEHGKSATAGPPIRGMSLIIVDEDERKVPDGEIGEIAIKGDNLFSGYFNQPELTEASFTPKGFFKSGDFARLDQKGRVVVIGRKKEMLIRGGFNVYPAEVEEQILNLEAVQYAAVVGIPDEKLGEKICACIVLNPGFQSDGDEIRHFCKKNLANYKVPDIVEIMDTFPMTTTNKIQKFKIRELMLGKFDIELS